MDQLNNLTWVIGGAQGTGVDSAANVFARACALAGLHVYGNREYYSNIMGEHSYFQVRVAEISLKSHQDPIDLLVTFDAETVVRHARLVEEHGAVLYDPDLGDTSIESIATLEPGVRQDLLGYLSNHEAEQTVSGLLGVEARRGVLVVPVPYHKILQEVQRQFRVDQTGKVARMVNLIAVGASFGLLDFRGGAMDKAIEAVFRAKPKVAEMNVWAARRAFELVGCEYGERFAFRLEPRDSGGRHHILVNGTQAAALGKLAGGCRFQTYYPITPASDESVYLEAHALVPARGGRDDDAEAQAAWESEGGGWATGSEFASPRPHDDEPGLGGSATVGRQPAGRAAGTLVVQTEDEIAAMAMAIGAALTGTRTATATSGPGFSLMVEALGWAGMNEVPVVITLYQRGGPSTGLPTRHEQGDLRFVLSAGHGEFARIVLASGDLEETFQDAIRAFNYAERYQVPVIHVLDKALANTSCTVPAFDPSVVRIDRGGPFAAKNGRYKRFLLTESGISPRAVLGQEGTDFWNTGDEHDEAGHVTEDPSVRNRMMEKRMEKLGLALQEIPAEDQAVFHGDPDARIVIVSWGSTKGAILDAMSALRDEGHKLGFLQVRLLSPFPADLIARHLQGRQTVVGVEMNYSGQLAGLLREKTGIGLNHFIVKYNGRPMSMTELRDALRGILDRSAPERQVLTHGI